MKRPIIRPPSRILPPPIPPLRYLPIRYLSPLYLPPVEHRRFIYASQRHSPGITASGRREPRRRNPAVIVSPKKVFLRRKIHKCSILCIIRCAAGGHDGALRNGNAVHDMKTGIDGFLFVFRNRSMALHPGRPHKSRRRREVTRKSKGAAALSERRKADRIPLFFRSLNRSHVHKVAQVRQMPWEVGAVRQYPHGIIH